MIISLDVMRRATMEFPLIDSFYLTLNYISPDLKNKIVTKIIGTSISIV